MDFLVFNVIMHGDLVVGDLEHTWYFNCGRCSTLPYYWL